jgi:hypothetical protein
MKAFESMFGVTDSTRILDVGGTQFNWTFLGTKPRVVIVNLSQPSQWDASDDRFTFEIGNGTALRFADGSFDIAYSNSVVEHLGAWENQVLFANELRRIGKGVYVQTPALEFFVEPHLLTPFIHWLPLPWQSKLMRNFTIWGWITRPSKEYIESFLAERKLLRRDEFATLFPDCAIYEEKVLWFTKSYVAVRIGNDA